MWPHAGWWSWFNQLFHLARSRTSIFFFLGLQHCNYSISVPNIFDSYLLHANPIVSKTRAKGSAKRECNNPSCVGVLFSLDAPLISRLRWEVWLFPWKKQHMRLHADLLAKSDKGRLAPPERTESSQTAQGHALTYKSRSISAAHFGWTESFEIF